MTAAAILARVRAAFVEPPARELPAPIVGWCVDEDRVATVTVLGRCERCGSRSILHVRPGGDVAVKAWLVWSNQHRCWWGPNGRGYTADVREAGRYALDQARRCCALRSRRSDGVPPELVVPSPELLEAWAAAVPVRS